MRTIAGVLLLPMLSGCLLLSVRRTVRQEDLQSWNGVPLVELQTHTLFSTIPKRVELLQDGHQLWTYSNCVTRPINCSGYGASLDCSGGDQACCYNQFLVDDQRVEWYRAAGSCYTDCTVRPPSRACQPEGPESAQACVGARCPPPGPKPTRTCVGVRCPSPSPGSAVVDSDGPALQPPVGKPQETTP